MVRPLEMGPTMAIKFSPLNIKIITKNLGSLSPYAAGNCLERLGRIVFIANQISFVEDSCLILNTPCVFYRNNGE